MPTSTSSSTPGTLLVHTHRFDTHHNAELLSSRSHTPTHRARLFSFTHTDTHRHTPAHTDTHRHTPTHTYTHTARREQRAEEWRYPTARRSFPRASTDSNLNSHRFGIRLVIILSMCLPSDVMPVMWRLTGRTPDSGLHGCLELANEPEVVHYCSSRGFDWPSRPSQLCCAMRCAPCHADQAGWAARAAWPWGCGVCHRART